MHPNPARDAVRLQLPNDSPARIQLFAPDGRLLHDARITPQGGFAGLDLPRFAAAGLYSIRVEQEALIGTRRLVLE